MADYFSLVLMFVFCALLAGGLLFLAFILGPKKNNPEKSKPFECGNDPLQLPSGGFAIKFYLVALLFILFDVELTFLFPWAVVLKKLGTAAFVEMVIYLLVIVAGLFYAIKKGALEWD